MIFVLTKTVTPEWVPEVEALIPVWTWSYHQGSEKNIGEALAVGPRGFASEREARSAIAKARKAFGGARMAKVCQSADIGVDNA